MKKQNIVIMTGVFFLCLMGLSRADSMRCGDRIVETGDFNAKVILRCGQPFYREVTARSGTQQSQTKGIATVVIPNRQWDYSASTSSNSLDISIEKWFYNLGEGQFIRILTFEEGILKKIELGDKP